MRYDLPFAKYQGAGNDFVIFLHDALSHLPHAEEVLPPRAIRHLCDRHFGVGADGVIVLRKLPGDEGRMEMRYFNSDGCEAAMCGNGARCALQFASAVGMVPDIGTLVTPSGSVSGCAMDSGTVWILLPDVGMPRFDPESTGWIIDTGVPHLVIATQDIDDARLMQEAEVHRHRIQPDGANVDYYQVVGSEIVVRTFERGVEAETLACGTGAVAAALIAAKRHREVSSPVVVHQRGGTMEVHFEEQSDPYGWGLIRLYGPATKAFEGVVSLTEDDFIDV